MDKYEGGGTDKTAIFGRWIEKNPKDLPVKYDKNIFLQSFNEAFAKRDSGRWFLVSVFMEFPNLSTDLSLKLSIVFANKFEKMPFTIYKKGQVQDLCFFR